MTLDHNGIPLNEATGSILMRDGRADRLSDVGSMQLQASSDNGAYTIALAGELDLASRAVLERALERAETTSAKLIVLDLRELDFIDSAGLHTIARAHQRAPRRLIIVRGPKQVQRLFELCALNEALTLVDEPPREREADRSSAPEPTGGAVDPIGDPPSRANPRGTGHRAHQAVLAAAIRELRSRGRPQFNR